MISTKRNDPRQSLAFQRRTLFLCVCSWLAAKEYVVAVFNLLDSVGIIITEPRETLPELLHYERVLTKSQVYLHNRGLLPSC